MRPIIAIAALALALTGCASSEAANPADNYRSELNQTADHMKEPGGEFLPTYVDMLQGKRPFPTDDLWCKPQNLGELMRPCESMEPDEGGK
jgi:hypothetical protein